MEYEFNKWKVGDLNTSGIEIKHIFHRKRDHYIIYESDVSSLVSYKANPEHQYVKKLLQFEKEFSLIKGLLIDYKQRKRFLPSVASAIKCSFEDKPETTKEIIKDILNSISNYKVRIGRLEYLAGAFTLGIVVVCVCFMLINLKWLTSESGILCKSMLFGVLGGFLSITTKLKKIEIDIESSNSLMHIVTGASRIIVSLISSILVLYLIESGLIIHSIINDENRESVILVFAALAGFSEIFIPNILSKFEKTTTSNSEQK